MHVSHTIVCGNLVCTNFVSVCDFVMCTQAHQILIGLNKSFHTIDVVFSKLYRMLKHIDLKVCIPDVIREVTYLLRTIFRIHTALIDYNCSISFLLNCFDISVLQIH